MNPFRSFSLYGILLFCDTNTQIRTASDRRRSLCATIWCENCRLKLQTNPNQGAIEHIAIITV